MKNTNKSRRPYPPERVFLGLPRQLPVAFSRPSPLTAFLLRLAESPRSTLSASSICYQKSHVLSGFFSIVPKQSKLNNADGRTPRLSFSLRGRARAPPPPSRPPLPPSPDGLHRRSFGAAGGAGAFVTEEGRKGRGDPPERLAWVRPVGAGRPAGRERFAPAARPVGASLRSVPPPPLSVLHH